MVLKSLRLMVTSIMHLKLYVTLVRNQPIALVNSVNPYRIEGQKTSAFEICDTLGCSTRYFSYSSWKCRKYYAYWKGFKEYNAEKTNGLPEMRGFEAEGCSCDCS